ncbi:MAG: SDR family oxidoreductase [Acidobacteria bacterium]|nr:SDR family oxidoreductase [Acidobacteriota bacterium]
MALKTKTLSEQVAVVTGGGTGIGRAFAGALAGAGTRVVIASRREKVLRRTAAELNEAAGAERVFPYAFDVRERGACEALVSHAVERHGALDVLVNNSGLAVPETIEELTEDGWDKVLETNLKGAMWLVRAALPEMTRRDFGDIVNVSSQAGKNGYADVPSYCASKWGLLGFAESVRDHARKTGANVRVFNFFPGLVDVENTTPEASPRPGSVHVSNMARTLLYALSLDREVVLEDINIYAR